MKERSVDETAPIYFGEKLASSQAFAGLFRDGMALVEETAAYLDGSGRQEHGFEQGGLAGPGRTDQGQGAHASGVRRGHGRFLRDEGRQTRT